MIKFLIVFINQKKVPMLSVTKYLDSRYYYHVPTGYVFFKMGNKYPLRGVDRNFTHDIVHTEEMDWTFTKLISNITSINVVWPDEDHIIHDKLQQSLLNTKTQEILYFGCDKASSFIVGKNIEHLDGNYPMPAPLYLTKRNTTKVAVFSCPRSIRSKICFEYLKDPVIFELPDSCFYGRDLDIIKQCRQGFYKCCEHGYLDAAKFLYQFGNLTYNLDDAFYSAYSDEGNDCADWLFDLKEMQKFELREFDLTSAYLNRSER